MDEDKRRYNIITQPSQRWENNRPTQIPLWEDHQNPEICVRRVTDIPVRGETSKDNPDPEDNSGAGDTSMDDASSEGKPRTGPRSKPPSGSKSVPSSKKKLDAKKLKKKRKTSKKNSGKQSTGKSRTSKPKAGTEQPGQKPSGKQKASRTSAPELPSDPGGNVPAPPANEPVQGTN